MKICIKYLWHLLWRKSLRKSFNLLSKNVLSVLCLYLAHLSHLKYVVDSVYLKTKWYWFQCIKSLWFPNLSKHLKDLNLNISELLFSLRIKENFLFIKYWILFQTYHIEFHNIFHTIPFPRSLQCCTLNSLIIICLSGKSDEKFCRLRFPPSFQFPAMIILEWYAFGVCSQRLHTSQWSPEMW